MWGIAHPVVYHIICLKWFISFDDWLIVNNCTYHIQLFIQEVGRKASNKLDPMTIAETPEEQDEADEKSSIADGAKFVVRGEDQLHKQILDPNFVVRGEDQPHKPLLDPKAHALTGQF